jgi:hypothetical protein
MAKDALSCGIREVSKVAEMFIRQINGIANALLCSFTNAMADFPW